MIRAVAVVVPARDEQGLLGACLDSLRRAARHPRVRGVPVRVTVVADACTDGTAVLARRHGADVVELAARNVGAARAAGSARALDLVIGGGLAPHEVWLAHTDADSRVPSGWLAHQLDCAAAGWCAVAGTVRVTDWTGHPSATAVAFRRHCLDEQRADRHPFVHGANLGVRADAYRAAGGFPPLPVGEDRVLVAALEAAGVPVGRTGRHPVTTSARRDARARGGFGDFLLGLTR